MTLTEFLAARLDEDERAALDAGSGTWYDHLDESNLSEWDIKHADRHSPARVLREVEAGRKILAEHSSEDSDWCHTCESGTGSCLTLRLLATIWSDHPDYDEAWRP